MGNKIYLSQPSDLPLLHFLWRWKLSTTAALSSRFYPKVSGQGAYLRLWRLEKAKFIQANTTAQGRHNYWTLSMKGYSILRPYLPPLSQDGYRTENPAHDLLVSSIHLGEGIQGGSRDLEYFTEQERRRIHPDYFPHWVPKDSWHIPDGFWHIRTPVTKTVALEVELTPKRRLDYEKIVAFYDSHPGIHSVLWVVSKTSLIRTVTDAVRQVTDGNTRHNFVLLRDVLSHGWHAKISSGPQSQKTMDCSLENCGQTPGKHVFPMFSMDTRKSPFRSTRSKDFSLTSFLDWVGYTAS